MESQKRRMVENFTRDNKIKMRYTKCIKTVHKTMHCYLFL